ncbi:MAG: hypothetical protein FJY38_05465 [Betaproteobacteria bacterium]|nr:hypothetical protein [Betaproteobacteria bacterium]
MYAFPTLDAMPVWSSTDWLKDLKMPTLVIVDDKNRSTRPSVSVVLWEGIPGSEFCILRGCAHGAHLEKPDLFNLVVGNFLSTALRAHRTLPAAA